MAAASQDTVGGYRNGEQSTVTQALCSSLPSIFKHSFHSKPNKLVWHHRRKLFEINLPWTHLFFFFCFFYFWLITWFCSQLMSIKLDWLVHDLLSCQVLTSIYSFSYSFYYISGNISIKGCLWFHILKSETSYCFLAVFVRKHGSCIQRKKSQYNKVSPLGNIHINNKHFVNK